MGNPLKGIVLFVLFFFVTLCLSAQIIDTAWTRTYGGVNWYDAYEGNSVQQTTDGGYIVAGTARSLDLYDVYLIKTDSLGDSLWTRTYGGDGREEGRSVQQTTDGGYIVAGETGSLSEGTDVYLIKTDPDGDSLWARTYRENDYGEGRSVQQTTDGGYIVTGNIHSDDEGGICLIKTDSIGDTLWIRTYQIGRSSDCGTSVQQTTDGGYIIAGDISYGSADSADKYLIKTDSIGDTLWTRTYYGWTNFGCDVKQTTDGGYIVAGGNSHYPYLIKTDADGDSLWAKTYGYDNWGHCRSVQQTTDGGYIVAGSINDAGSYDLHLIKMDSLGDTLWTRKYGGDRYDHGTSVQQTTDGGYIVAGTTGSYSEGRSDVYLLKIESSNGIRVTSPNGGEEWQADNTYDITWTSYETSGAVKIEYSLNNGLDWTEIIASTPDDGSHPWTTPYTTSDSCLVRVSDTNGLLEDISNSVFRIFPPFITVISPNGGEIWRVDSTYNITWASAGIGSDVKIEYSINNGSDWMSIEDTILNIESYSWIIPFAPSDSCLVKIASLDDSISDTSDSLFTIFSPPFITVTSPDGGEEWQADSTHDVTWTSYGTSGAVKIEYSLNNGLDWTEIIASTPDDGSYPWPIPDTMSYNCLVRISDTNGTISDISNSVFTIYSEPFIIVTSPNGGETWTVDSTYNITWSSVGIGSSVSIEYSINNGSDWMSIEDTIPDTETYPWTIPFTPSDSCLVKIASLDGSISDTSDSVFTIFSPPFIKVTSPNGGEEWQADSIHDITWTSYQTSGGAKIEYSLNNGLDWMEIIASMPDTGAYPWTIPDTLSYNCLVRVSDTNGGLSDISDGVFTIFSVPIITLISPNGGEKWYNEDDHYINWVSAGTSGEVKIDYSINNGLDWTEIIASIPDSGSYLWNPPDTTSDSCLVSISDTNGSIADTSDTVFSIIPMPAGVPIGSLEVYSLNVKAVATASQLDFTYTLPEKANDIRFTLYNVAGLKIREENIKETPAGFYSGKINLGGVSNGIYFIKMEVNGGKFTQTKKFLLM